MTEEDVNSVVRWMELCDDTETKLGREISMQESKLLHDAMYDNKRIMVKDGKLWIEK